MVWLPLFGIFNVRTHVDACDCTQGLYGHRKRVCTGNWVWDKKYKKSLAFHRMVAWSRLPIKLYCAQRARRFRTRSWLPRLPVPMVECLQYCSPEIVQSMELGPDPNAPAPSSARDCDVDWPPLVWPFHSSAHRERLDVCVVKDTQQTQMNMLPCVVI